MAVRAWRSRLDISQETLGERAGLHRTYICDVERGARNVSLESIEKLARALEVSVPALLSYVQDPLTGELVPVPVPGHELLDILLVEDLADDVEMTLLALKRTNIANRIQVVGDGAEALNFLFHTGKYAQRRRQDAPQLILLDLGLPKIDGLEVLRQVKTELRTSNIPVIVLTSSTSGRDLATCKR
ncbi:MAG TPA: helix-turn-helix domain-containing protein, partial [Verrucomicrobiae bacterium]